MCQGKTAIEITKDKEKKCFVVMFGIVYHRDEPLASDRLTPIKVFASKTKAKAFIENETNNRKEEWKFTESLWETDYEFYATNNQYTYCWEICETQVDDEIQSDFHYPPIEKENEVLRNECWNLRKQLSEVTQRNAVAATYATMWDGGRDYTKEHVLENLHTVKEVLAGDHKKVTELFEKWLKDRETK